MVEAQNTQFTHCDNRRTTAALMCITGIAKIAFGIDLRGRHITRVSTCKRERLSKTVVEHKQPLTRFWITDIEP